MDRSPEGAEQGWSRNDTFVAIGIGILSLGVRCFRLATPGALVFDETYYVRDACRYLAPALRCATGELTEEVHPPLGKWLIALGMRTVGDQPIGWRVASAIVGALSVVVLFILARRLFRSLVPATVAALLLCFESLHFVQSRTAMLDIFPVFFGLLAVLFILIDRDRATFSARRSIVARPWRYAAGIAAGAAGASKTSGWLFLVVILVLAVFWDVRRHHRAGARRPLDAALRAETLNLFLSLVAVPVFAYAATYVGRLDGSLLALPWHEGSWINVFLTEQKNMAAFHSAFYNITPLRSAAWSWILLKGPLSYYFRSGNGVFREIVSLGSPLVWWGSIPALLFAVVRWVKERFDPELVIVAGFFFTYIVWIFASALRPTAFFFYALPAVPFMCLALANVVRYVPWPRATATALVGLNVLLFVFLYPIVAAVPVPGAQRDARLWFDRCRPASVGTITGTNRTGTFTSEVVINADPPRGWCWGQGRPSED